jgi:hypothetical protein
MKSISASLVVLSGSLIVVASIFRSDAPGDNKDIGMLLGIATLVVGLIVWGMTVFRKDQQH